MTVDTEALIAAVRAGDIEAAQALLPVDPIVKRAREICARHFGDPARFLRGDMDGAPMIGAVTEALRSPAPIDADTVLRMARAAAYVACPPGHVSTDYLNGEHDSGVLVRDLIGALRAAAE